MEMVGRQCNKVRSLTGSPCEAPHQLHQQTGGCMSNEYEHSLEIALNKLEDRLLNKHEIEIIRSACGKPTGELVAERNHELLDSVFHDIGRIFRK